MIRIMDKGSLYFCALLFLFLSSCLSDYRKEEGTKEDFFRDLPEIRKEGTLKVITTYNSTSYFLYRGEPMGYEYEMAARLAKSLGLKLEVVVAKSFNEVFELLKSGKGDLIVFGLTITEDRKRELAFTHYLYTTHQVLVQRKPGDWKNLPTYKLKNALINNPYELIGDTVFVGEGTSYISRLKNLEDEIGGKIIVQQLKGNITTDDVIKMVVEGWIDYTVADYNIANVNKNYYPILDIDTRLSLSQRIAWAVRKNSPQLLAATNEWIRKSRKKQFYYALYDKYFNDHASYRKRMSSHLFSRNTGKISPYDSLIRYYSWKTGLDWRLISSIIYQESQFDPEKEGRFGSGGLMQLMPNTAEELGVKDLFNPEQNIKAGILYLKQMYERLHIVKDSVQRMKFTLAAYNCGLGHILDAQRLAESVGDSSGVWDNHVERAILKLGETKYYARPEVRHGIVRGVVPYKYVRDVFHRFEQYKQLVPKE